MSNCADGQCKPGINLCPWCAQKSVQISFLKMENDKLKRKNHKLRQRLAAVLAYVNKVLHEAGKVLEQRSGVQRGRWSYVKGADHVAGSVRRLIRGW